LKFSPRYSAGIPYRLHPLPRGLKHKRGSRDQVEITRAISVNAEPLNIVSKSGIIIRLIETRTCALHIVQSISGLSNN
jgi:hypothetical protein